MALTIQQQDPHTELVQVREAIAKSLGDNQRATACRLANELTHKECDAILKETDPNKVKALAYKTGQKDVEAKDTARAASRTKSIGAP